MIVFGWTNWPGGNEQFGFYTVDGSLVRQYNTLHQCTRKRFLLHIEEYHCISLQSLFMLGLVFPHLHTSCPCRRNLKFYTSNSLCIITVICFSLNTTGAWGTSLTVPGSIPGDITWDFFRGSFRQNHVPWGRLSLWKWVPRISPGVKAAGAFGGRPTTLVVPKVKKIRGLNLPGTPRATSACRGIPLLYFSLIQHNLVHNCI